MDVSCASCFPDPLNPTLPHFSLRDQAFSHASEALVVQHQNPKQQFISHVYTHFTPNATPPAPQLLDFACIQGCSPAGQHGSQFIAACQSVWPFEHPAFQPPYENLCPSPAASTPSTGPPPSPNLVPSPAPSQTSSVDQQIHGPAMSSFNAHDHKNLCDTLKLVGDVVEQFRGPSPSEPYYEGHLAYISQGGVGAPALSPHYAVQKTIPLLQRQPLNDRASRRDIIKSIANFHGAMFKHFKMEDWVRMVKVAALPNPTKGAVVSPSIMLVKGQSKNGQKSDSLCFHTTGGSARDPKWSHTLWMKPCSCVRTERPLTEDALVPQACRVYEQCVCTTDKRRIFHVVFNCMNKRNKGGKHGTNHIFLRLAVRLDSAEEVEIIEGVLQQMEHNPLALISLLKFTNNGAIPLNACCVAPEDWHWDIATAKRAYTACESDDEMPSPAIASYQPAPTRACKKQRVMESQTLAFPLMPSPEQQWQYSRHQFVQPPTPGWLVQQGTPPQYVPQQHLCPQQPYQHQLVQESTIQSCIQMPREQFRVQLQPAFEQQQRVQTQMADAYQQTTPYQQQHQTPQTSPQPQQDQSAGLPTTSTVGSDLGFGAPVEDLSIDYDADLGFFDPSPDFDDVFVVCDADYDDDAFNPDE